MDKFAEEMILDIDVTRAITIHGVFTHRDARGIVFPHFSRATLRKPSKELIG